MSKKNLLQNIYNIEKGNKGHNVGEKIVSKKKMYYQKLITLKREIRGHNVGEKIMSQNKLLKKMYNIEKGNKAYIIVVY